MTLLGRIDLQRHYYHCSACAAGFYPWDDILNLTAPTLSPAAEEVTCIAGLQASFAEGSSKPLQRMVGLRLSESTVERTTENAGQRLNNLLSDAATLGPAQDWAWHKDAEGQSVAYVSVDATGVGQQGSDGAKADGRMVNVAMLYNPVPEDRAAWAHPDAVRRPAWQARYLASLETLADMGTRLRRQAAQIGMAKAERWIALSDGGNGLEAFLEMNFPRVEAVILDFYHASEHLTRLAKAWHPRDEAAAQALTGQWCHQLKHEGGAAVLAVLRDLPLAGRSLAARTIYDEERGYFENQVHRMDYPTYRAKGWQIGSGPIESACKRVIGQRLKGTGMRWGVDGANAVSHLRALFLSEASQWTAFWDYEN